MISLLAIAASGLAISQEMVTIRVTGREMVGLRNRQNVIRGTCDGRPASATIIQTDRGRTGRLVLRGGRWSREVPPTFLNGSLVSNGLYYTGLACDGSRLQLSALAVRGDAHGDLVMDKQNAILDLRTGVLTVTDLRTLSPAETREELN